MSAGISGRFVHNERGLKQGEDFPLTGKKTKDIQFIQLECFIEPICLFYLPPCFDFWLVKPKFNVDLTVKNR